MKRIVNIFFIALFLTSFTTFCTKNPETPDVQKTNGMNLIVDTDMGLDDIRALMALLADTSINIHGIITVEGSAALGKATDNLIGFLETNYIESIPILMGYSNSGLPPPSWRKMANEAGGVKFPPPRHISANKLTAERFDELIHHTSNIEYLALGPAGNLAKLADERPDAFKGIKRIWIPAAIENNNIAAWNLRYDITAAQRVFNSASAIVIVDIPAILQEDAATLLSAAEGDSRSVQWISETLLKIDRSSEHLRSYNDIAAAAIISGDLLVSEERRYTVRLNENNHFELISDPVGNITVAKLVEVEEAFTVLKNLWRKNPAPHHTEHEAIVPVRDLLRTFHGHLGPYVVIGYRMGKLALRELHSQGHFGLSTEVHSLLTPPHSCLIDGIQLGSGCTLGKRNIRIQEYGGPAWAVFETKQGVKTTIRLRSGIPELVKLSVEQRGVETSGEELLTMDISDIFIVE